MSHTRVPSLSRRALLASLVVAAALVSPRAAAAVARPASSPGLAPGAWAVVGNAADEDGYLLLTPDENFQAGAVWQRDPVDLREGFDRTFVLSFGDDDVEGADGIVFVLQRAGLDALGATGQGIGYAGVTPSVGVELDTFQNADDPVEDHVAVDENGSTAHGGVAPVPLANLEDGREHALRVAWDPAATTLSVDVDGALALVYTKDMVADVFGGEPLVTLGFTAGTGGSRNRHYVRAATPPGLLSWTAPAGGALDPPSDLVGTIAEIGPPPDTTGERGAPAAVLSYRVYRSSEAGFTPGPDTLFAVVPPTATSTRAPLGVAGSHFVVTAVTDAGESAPSNEVALGGPGPVLSKTKVKPAKIDAKGTGFSREVSVFLDGIGFAAPATVKKGKHVVQKGPLNTGVDPGDYLAPGRTVTVTIANDDGTLVSTEVTVR